jgi:catechol 2,3-dioxygenase-like lactoylglutathione lyase family enzyme
LLGEHPIDVMLLATDLAVAKDFYGSKIGLEVLIETDDFVTFRAGGDSRLVVSRSTTGTKEEQTKASWRVDDITTEVAELRSRGVEIVEFDSPGAEDRRRRRRYRLRARRLVR